MERYLTVKEFSRMFNLTPNTVYKLVGAGKIAVVRVGRNIRFPVPAVEFQKTAKK